MLKERIDSLGIVLKNCEFDKKKLEAMFPKKQAPKKNVHHAHAHVHKSQSLHHAKYPKDVHTSHTHHAFMYGKVYACTYCYDRINASHNHVWVRNTNIQGPKKVWVSKSTVLLNDVGTFQRLTT